MQRNVQDLARPSVAGMMRKTTDYAMRPLIDFNKHDTLEMLENLQNAARDTKHEKIEYCRLTCQTVRAKIHLPSEHFKDFVLRLFGDMNYQKVFETVAKVKNQSLKCLLPPIIITEGTINHHSNAVVDVVVVLLLDVFIVTSLAIA